MDNLRLNEKDPVLKEGFHTKYKKYRNLLSTLMKKSKQAHYDKYFERNCNNIKNTWKGIKSLISLITVASHVPTILSLDNGDTIFFKKTLTLWPLFMDGVQLHQGYSHFEETVYFSPFSSQKFLVLILSTSEGWKAESTLEPPSGFEHRTPGLGIQHLNH